MLYYENISKIDSNYYERVFDTETRKSHFNKVDVTPYVYVPSVNGEYSYFLDKSVKLAEKRFNNESEMTKWCKTMKESGLIFYGKTTPKYQYLKDHFYFDSEKNYVNNNHQMRIWTIDIEVSQEFGFPYPNEAKAPVTLIQFYDSFDERYYVIGYKDIEGHEDPKDLDRVLEFNRKHGFPDNTTYLSVSTEAEMFKYFIKLIKVKMPAIWSAWNGELFDYPYLINRMVKLGLNKNDLSPLQNSSCTYSKDGGQDIYRTEISGIYLLDLMILYKKFTFTPQTSYSLNNISREELGAEKVEYSEFENLDELMKSDYERFTRYGIVDVQLTKGIDDKLNLINLVKSIAYKMGINLEDALGTVKPWGTYINNIAYAQGYILPNDGSSGGMDYDGIQGAWVADPIVGKHNWVVSFDWASLYPSIIRWCNFSPETWIPTNKLPKELLDIKQKYFIDDEDHIIDKRDELLENVTPYLEKYNVSAGINGSFYTKEYDGLIPILIKQLYGERKSDKKEMFKYSQLKERIKGVIQEKKAV